MSKTKDKPFTTIREAQDIPSGMTETEAQVYWDTHEVSAALITQGIDEKQQQRLTKARKTQSRNISLNLNQQLERRLRAVAEMEGVGYQTLIKQFVLERVYQEELRLGIIKEVAQDGNLRD